MERSIRRYILGQIEGVWEGSNCGYRPDYTWIREYEGVPSDYYGQTIHNVPINLWLLSKEGLFIRNVWEWERLKCIKT